MKNGHVVEELPVLTKREKEIFKSFCSSLDDWTIVRNGDDGSLWFSCGWPEKYKDNTWDDVTGEIYPLDTYFDDYFGEEDGLFSFVKPEDEEPWSVIALLKNCKVNKEVGAHKLKISPEYFEAVKNGTKTFELRDEGQRFKVGDRLELFEYIDGKNEYTGEMMTAVITYKLENCEFHGLEEGYCILGIAVIPEPYKEVE